MKHIAGYNLTCYNLHDDDDTSLLKVGLLVGIFVDLMANSCPAETREANFLKVSLKISKSVREKLLKKRNISGYHTVHGIVDSLII